MRFDASQPPRKRYRSREDVERRHLRHFNAACLLSLGENNFAPRDARAPQRDVLKRANYLMGLSTRLFDFANSRRDESRTNGKVKCRNGPGGFLSWSKCTREIIRVIDLALKDIRDLYLRLYSILFPVQHNSVLFLSRFNFPITLLERRYGQRTKLLVRG